MGRPRKISDDDILAAAREVFLKEGAGASTVTIAEKAGISEASIFKRFGTKQMLFLSAMGVTTEPDWVKELKTRTPTAEIKAELLELCVHMLSLYQEVVPRMLMMMTQGQMPSMMPPVVPPPFKHKRLLAGFLKRGIDKGYLRSCNPDIMATIIVGTLINNVVTKTMMERLTTESSMYSSIIIEPKQLVDELIETLWVGIAPDQ